jgi:rRNA maturation endonuclease Nob1
MKYRIIYCDNCGREYTDVLNYYGERCENCGTELKMAWKVEEKWGSCVKFIESCRKEIVDSIKN